MALVLGGTLLALATTATAASHTLEWTRQLGTSDFDWSYGVSADGLGNVYMSGLTRGDLQGTNAGERDALLTKYNASGTLLWTNQFGTSSYDIGNAVSADGLGNIYISGVTGGNLGGPLVGYGDAFISKFDDSGTLLWTRQLGTTQWDTSYGMAADGLGNIYISGYTWGSLEGTNAGYGDAFVSKYDDSGTLLWTRQPGSNLYDISNDVTADSAGNVYIAGVTSTGPSNFADHDAFVIKYDANGMLLWSKQFGTVGDDQITGVSSDGLGNVYISGHTSGSLGGTNAGSGDAFFSKYDANGALLWTEQLGTSSDDCSHGVSADGLGNVYISGTTLGSLGGTNAGNADAFIAKFSDPIPEPLILALVDIKPGSVPNSVNLKSKGVLPVAILGTDEFDVTEVKFDTLRFGDPLLIGNGTTGVRPLRSALEDVSGDGLLDLTLKFSTADLVEYGALGPDTIEGLLTGALFDGTLFEGMDSIRIVPPKGSKGNNLQISAVPEPSSLLLGAMATVGLLLRRRR
ncbi:MAG: SBBP repeat-containing protein [Planctomycetes bacterium]|nr:SBBP repeat-containing protein [Planctomycetota bacterium]